MFQWKRPELSRRDLLKLSAAGVLGASAAKWFNLLACQAAEVASQGAKHKSCILLWMKGGPSQAHTFDLKPGGEYKAIPTSVPGIEVCEHLPKVAQQMEHMAVLRGMSTGESSHKRATYLMHKGFRQGAGGTVYPSIGSVVAKELGQSTFELPNYVAVNLQSSGAVMHMGSGYLGAKQSPLVVSDPAKGVENIKPLTSMDDLDERAGLVGDLDKDLLSDYKATAMEAHQRSYEKAVQMMHSNKSKAFDIADEPASLRDAYGRTRFGEGCLMARRLVEAGVPFVEVVDAGKWDTHGGAAARVKGLLGPIDPAWATLIRDLKGRGLLDSTLVIWMGEFGRTPGSGTGHFARAWSTVFCGAGLKTGQAIGHTGKSGGTVEDRPIRPNDFMATICKALGIDHEKQYRGKGGRPFRIVDKDAKPVEQLFA